MPIGVAMVAISALVWWPAFTLGAYGEIFFDQLLGVWAAATAAFVFVLVERRPVGVRLLRAFLLLLPSLWLLLMFTLGDETQDLLVFIVDTGAILALLIGMPFTLFVLVQVVWPDFGSEAPSRARVLVMTVALGIAAASFLLGVNQAHFLTCDDYSGSGMPVPSVCTPEQPDDS